MPPGLVKNEAKQEKKQQKEKKFEFKISEVKSSIHSRLLMPFVNRLSARFPGMLEVISTRANLQLKQSSFRFPLINTLLLLKSSENDRFSDNFREDRS